MKASDLNAGLEVLDAETCQRLLASQSVGRFAVVVDGRAEVFPVVFRATGHEIFARMADSTVLTAVLRGPVSFQVDHFDDDGRTGWSVLAHGRASLAASPAVSVRSWRRAVLPHSVRFTITGLSGRRLSA
ncbi:MAG: pyridoxamine 5'-phosphate oxidase family protein [Acidimicrobiaceae bacterium]|nr:pyridoxamine 5'-phosphate oxidase family protein [Acidimicrobiaceae bacterium]